MSPSLLIAITIWKRGEPIPVDLAFQLAQRGLDVEALEARYRA